MQFFTGQTGQLYITCVKAKGEQCEHWLCLVIPCFVKINAFFEKLWFCDYGRAFHDWHIITRVAMVSYYTVVIKRCNIINNRSLELKVRSCILGLWIWKKLLIGFREK